ncbi:MAG: hypothetical protein EZS28_019053 [Streblomastix strix]|uniref:Reverse transcriptase domain-containing protein n=1 Tax=Streblomastix strix TaxID=222440 RepID=A0A5J4VS82_9EUKA|nr:MAG: hypothetical protein EZS28_019053 [Streblomastix strix]
MNNGWAITQDLQSAYSHITVSAELSKYLAFRFGGLTYTYTTMPFGTATVLHVFTNAMMIILQNLRAHGINCTSYLDDGIEWFENQEEAKFQMMYTFNLFMELELTINFEKSMLIPTQNPNYLGIQWDSRKIVAILTQLRLGVIQASIGSWMQINENTKTARQLASLVGQ